VYDELLILPFEATNIPPLPFAWATTPARGARIRVGLNANWRTLSGAFPLSVARCLNP